MVIFIFHRSQNYYKLSDTNDSDIANTDSSKKGMLKSTQLIQLLTDNSPLIGVILVILLIRTLIMMKFSYVHNPKCILWILMKFIRQFLNYNSS